MCTNFSTQNFLVVFLLLNLCVNISHQFTGRSGHISPKECKSEKSPELTGICMISLECQQRSGTVIGACADGPLFGACCHAPSDAPSQLGAKQETSLSSQATVTTDNNAAGNNKTNKPITANNEKNVSTNSQNLPVKKINETTVKKTISPVPKPLTKVSSALFRVKDKTIVEVDKPNTNILLKTNINKSELIKDAKNNSSELDISSAVAPETKPKAADKAKVSVKKSSVVLKKPITPVKQKIETKKPAVTVKPKVVTKVEQAVDTKKNTEKTKIDPKPTVTAVKPTKGGIVTTEKPVVEARAQSVKLSNKDEKIMEELILASDEEPTKKGSSETKKNTEEQLFPTMRRKLEKVAQKKKTTLGPISGEFEKVADSFTNKKNIKPVKTKDEIDESKKLKEDHNINNKSMESDADSQENWSENLNDFVSQVVNGMAEGLEKNNLEDKLLNSKKTIDDTKKSTRTDLSEEESENIQSRKNLKTEDKTSNKKTSKKSKKKKQKKNALDYRKHCGVRPLIKSGRNGRIVGGRPSRVGSWPWFALVKESYWWGLFSKVKCGGVLISPRHVLTAAHCQPKKSGSLTVVLGMRDADDTESISVTKPVRRVIRHPYFNHRTYDNDVAVLELETPVKLQPHIVPICLPQDDENYEGKYGFVTGMGLMHHGERSMIVQEVDVPILNNTVCQTMFLKSGNMKPIKPSFICAGGEPGKDSCGGDSGGPLSVQRDNGQWVLAGTVSHGIKCALPNQPGVHMRTSFYKKWIMKVAKMTRRNDSNKNCYFGNCREKIEYTQTAESHSRDFGSTFWRVVSLAGKVLLALAER